MRIGPSRTFRPASAFFRRALLACTLGGAVAFFGVIGRAQDAPPRPADDTPTNRDEELRKQAELPKDAEVFRAVRDGEALGDAEQTEGERKALLAVLEHAGKVPEEALERHSRKNLRYSELAGPGHASFLRDPIRVQGRITRTRLLEAAPLVGSKAPSGGLYEAWLSTDAAGKEPVCLLFLKPPHGVGGGDMTGRRVAFDGYYFKMLAYSAGTDDDGKPIRRTAPLLVGKSPHLLGPEEHVGAADEAARVRLPKSDPVFGSVLDKRPVANRAENADEYTAYGLVFRQASETPPELLAKYARRDVVYADLIGGVREQFLREPLHIEGRLVRLRQRDASDRLRETSDIQKIYEGWVYFKNEYEHPICIAFTELPPEIQPGETLSYRVAFDGYYFKLMAYESQKPDKDRPGKNEWHVAPFLIGRRLELVETSATMWSLANGFVPLVLVVIGLVFAAGLGLTLWYRRSDRHARARMDALGKANPFTEPEAAPPVQPGTAWNRLGEPPPN
jgi:hypothetical protein